MPQHPLLSHQQQQNLFSESVPWRATPNAGYVRGSCPPRHIFVRTVHPLLWKTHAHSPSRTLEMQLIYKQYSWWQNCASTFFVCLVSRGLNLSNSSWISFTCSVKGESGGLRPVC